MIRTLTPSRLRRSSPPPPAGEGRAKARPLRKYARRAGIVVLALLALDIIVGTAAVALGVDLLKR